MKRTYLLCIFIFMVIMIFALTGCSPVDKIYDSMTSLEATNEELELLTEDRLGFSADGTGVEGFAEWNKSISSIGKAFFTLICNHAKGYGGIICVCSICIGFVMLRLAPKSMSIKKTAIFFFILGIPLLTVATIYASAFFADAFH